MSLFFYPHPYSFEYNQSLLHYLYRINLFYDLMKNFLKQLRVLAQFIIGFSVGYFAFVLFSFPSLPSIILLMVSLFVLLKAAGNFDEINGLGPANNPSPDTNHKKNRPNHNMDNQQCDCDCNNNPPRPDFKPHCDCNDNNEPNQHEQF